MEPMIYEMNLLSLPRDFGSIVILIVFTVIVKYKSKIREYKIAVLLVGFILISDVYMFQLRVSNYVLYLVGSDKISTIQGLVGKVESDGRTLSISFINGNMAYHSLVSQACNLELSRDVYLSLEGKRVALEFIKGSTGKSGCFMRLEIIN